MIELLQFRHSPYNEKVRWALDVKRVPHRRRSLLPGPHALAVRRRTGGTATPVLCADGRCFDGSARIVAWLDERFPEPPLLPADTAQRAEALRIERWFDEDLTPRIRRPVLDALLRRPSDFAAMFGEGRAPAARIAYACSVPFAAPLVRRGNGIAGADTIADGDRAAVEALDFVAARAAATGYLVGATFGVADLAAASTLAALICPDGTPMAVPRPMGGRFRALIERHAQHPAARWVRDVYARHRIAKRDFEGASPSEP